MLLVSTSHTPMPATVEASKRMAQEMGWRWVPRAGMSIRKLMRTYGASELMLQADDELKLYTNLDGDPSEPAPNPMFFHPSMSFVRVKRLLQEEGDTMVEVSGVAEGDVVLDCTAGLASDSIVFSFVAGPKGRVIAVESAPALYMLVRVGLSRYETHLERFNEAMRRIELQCDDHERVLERMPDRSVDIVYFDPMFRHPIEESSGIQPLRQLANHEPLSESAVRQAMRVARKRVVLKEHRDGDEFKRLGFERQFRPGTKIAYGVIML